MRQGTLHRNPLRRYREAICFLAAFLLWVITWTATRDGYAGARGHRALAGIGAIEGLFLAALFLLEHRRRRPAVGRRWITIAWASLPGWVCLEVVISGALRATS